MDILSNIEEFKHALDDICNDTDVPDYTENSSVTVICNKEPSNHCDLTWTIVIDGRDVSCQIPEDLKHASMDTKNIYSYPNENIDEDYIFEEGGYDEDEWISINNYWLNTITTNDIVQRKIFRSIQKQEFTGCEECRGCE